MARGRTRRTIHRGARPSALKYAQDVDSARQAVEQIIERFPGSASAYAASQRLAHHQRLVLRGRPRRHLGIELVGLAAALGDDAELAEAEEFIPVVPDQRGEA